MCSLLHRARGASGPSLAGHITVRGDPARAQADYAARFEDSGDILEWRVVAAFTLLRHAGVWKITSLAYPSVEE